MVKLQFSEICCVLEPRHSAFSFWSRRLLAAAAVLFAFVWFAPQQAAASCGDYVLMDGHPAGGGSSMLGSGHSGPRHGFPICRGPGCRQSREMPPSPPTRVTLDEHSWGLPPKLVDLAPEPSLFIVSSRESVEALAVASGIFRPPRLIASV